AGTEAHRAVCGADLRSELRAVGLRVQAARLLQRRRALRDAALRSTRAGIRPALRGGVCAAAAGGRALRQSLLRRSELRAVLQLRQHTRVGGSLKDRPPTLD